MIVGSRDASSFPEKLGSVMVVSGKPPPPPAVDDDDLQPARGATLGVRMGGCGNALIGVLAPVLAQSCNTS